MNDGDQVGIESKGRKSGSSSLVRGLKIIRLLCEAPAPLSLAKLARALAMDPGNLHRLIRTLQDEGWVSRLNEGNEYIVGPLAMNNFDPWHPVHSFRRESYPILKLLHDQTEETAAVILFLGTERVVMDTIHGKLTLSSYYDVRLVSPIHGSASGKILLASIPDEMHAEILGSEPYVRHTDRTPTTYKELAPRISDVRQNCYEISRDEAFNGLVAYGAPIRYRDQTLGCLVLTASSTEIDPENDISYALKTRDSAELLSNSVPSIHPLKNFLIG